MALIDDQFADATACVNTDLQSLLTQLLSVQGGGGGGGGGGGEEEPGTGGITGAFQISLAGVVMDACDACAPLHVTRFFEGLGVAPKRNNDQKRMQHHGSFASPQYLDVRHLDWDVIPTGTAPVEFKQNVRDLCAAFIPAPDSLISPIVPMLFSLDDPAEVFVVFGKPGEVPIDYSEYLRGVHMEAEQLDVEPITCEFECLDPVIYGAELKSAETPLGATVSGFDVGGWGFPFGFGTILPGTARVENLGNMTTYPRLIFTAGGTGLSDIQAINQQTGETWSITLSLAIGDVLIVDMNAHTVLLNGEESRGGFVNRPPSVWFGARPGSTDVLFVGTGLGATMEVQWRDAFQF